MYDCLSGLHSHTSSIHEGKRIKCNECEKTFNAKPDMERHIRKFHRGEKKYTTKCEKCDQLFEKKMLKRVEHESAPGMKICFGW